MTKLTELNMFNFGDNVDRDTVDKEVERAGDSRLSTNRRQIGNKLDSRLCRQCVPGLTPLIRHPLQLIHLPLFAVISSKYTKSSKVGYQRKTPEYQSVPTSCG